jgi:hypothetical protein
MPTTKSTYKCRRRAGARARIRAVGKLKTSTKDAAKDNKVAEILTTLIKIGDNRRAYIINVEVISQRKIKKLRAFVDSGAQSSIYVDTATAQSIYDEFRILSVDLVHPKHVNGYNGDG